MKTKQTLPTWQQSMKKLKLQHIQQTAPNFYLASGGQDMITKPYSEKTDYKLAAAIAACLKYCGGETEIVYNFTLSKSRTGYTPVYGETWKPVRVTATFEDKALVIDVNTKSKNEAQSIGNQLFLRTNSFECFSNWFCGNFPGSLWAKNLKSACGSESGITT